MNKLRFFYPVAALMFAAPLFTSCSDDDDEIEITVRLNQTEIAYDAQGVWEGVATNNDFQSQYMVFNHEGEISPWGLVWSGFTPSRVSETAVQTNWVDHQFQILPGGGMSGKGTPFIVAYWNTIETAQTPASDRSCRVTYAANLQASPKAFRPVSVYVTNTAYTYYTMTEGSAFSRKFAAGDYLILRAHGVRADGSESTADFYLANCKGDDKSKWYVTDWQSFSLANLGEVTELYFTMESSDTGQWGMNTPSLFALDCLTVRAVLPD